MKTLSRYTYSLILAISFFTFDKIVIAQDRGKKTERVKGGLGGAVSSSNHRSTDKGKNTDLGPFEKIPNGNYSGVFFPKKIYQFNQDVGAGKSVNVKLVSLNNKSVNKFPSIILNIESRTQILKGEYKFQMLNDLKAKKFFVPIGAGNNVVQIPDYADIMNITDNKPGIVTIPDSDTPVNCIRGTQKIDITSPSFSIIGMGEYVNRFSLGQVYDKTSIVTDAIRPVNQERTPIKLYVPNASAAIITVSNPSPSNAAEINSAAQRLKATIEEVIPQVDFSKLEEVFTREEFFLRITAGGKCPFGTLDAMFSQESDNQSRKFFYDFTNSMFTLKADLPVGNKFFKNISPSDSMDIYENSAYLDQITYGRRLIISIETNKMTNNLKTDISATMQYLVYSGSINLSYEQKKLLEGLKITALVIGGNGDFGSAISLSDKSDLKNLIKSYIEDRDVRRAFPISMSFRDLYGNYLATKSTATDVRYDICLKKEGKLKVEVVNITPHGRNVDLTGRSIVRVYNSANQRLPYDLGQDEYLQIPKIRIPDGNISSLTNIVRYCNIDTFDDSVIELGADYQDQRGGGDEDYKLYNNKAPRISLRNVLSEIAKYGEFIWPFTYTEGENRGTLTVSYKFTVE